MIPWSIADFGRAEKTAARRVINSGWLTQGVETERFEKELSGFSVPDNRANKFMDSESRKIQKLFKKLNYIMYSKVKFK